MYITLMAEWIEQAVKYMYKQSLNGVCACVCVCVCVCTCMCMCEHVDRSYITFTVAEERWVGRERASMAISTLQILKKCREFRDNSHTDFRFRTILIEGNCSLSPSLRHTHLHTHTRDVVYERQQPTVLISLSTYSFS